VPIESALKDRLPAVERLPPDLQKSKFSSMMIKMEMQKIVLEREGDNPQKPALQETAQE